jgi:hypothetical protein
MNNERSKARFSMPRWKIDIGEDVLQRKGRPCEEISEEIERLCYQKTHIKWKNYRKKKSLKQCTYSLKMLLFEKTQKYSVSISCLLPPDLHA